MVTEERNARWALGAGPALSVALALGAALGALAVSVDEIDFAGARLILVFVSTGLSWGAAAILMERSRVSGSWPVWQERKDRKGPTRLFR